MAPHRKLRSSGPLGMRTPALATAALTSVALLSQTAEASPATEPTSTPSTEEIQKKIDDLYQQAGTATEKYNAAKEKTTKQRRRVDTLLGDVAKRTEKLNSAREALGNFAAAQYRTGASAPDSASLLLADDAQGYFDRTQLMNRLTARQQQAVDDYVTQRAATTKRRQEASEGLETLTATESRLRTSKADVQRKLAEARGILSRLSAGEKARLAAIERERQEEALRRADELARQQAADAERRRREAAAQAQQGTGASAGTVADAGTGAGTVAGAGSVPGSDSAATTGTAKAVKAVAFARAQIGKPYVWGASGPGSYDCSGLTQAAWKAAGVTLPRTTWDQVDMGTTVPVESVRPGDLVFFHDDISHVGVYIGDGMMIHAPKPGAYVREESVFSMPIHSVVRPA
ncbi:C40 family peptidase [Streptomyces apricus]|uniref:Glycoside hydrolase n=1 Tax=Streptomyces apricus TaxID=1828112 RepID=A0A5B0B125_9ACTN|nr:C40 family peptidase [Streptomyces apricus]KAA0935497.1 glycoside hydrolase [Streptomyces apricus]